MLAWSKIHPSFQEEVPQDLVPTETPEEMVTEAPEVEDSFSVTEAPEESVEMETTAPEMEEKAWLSCDATMIHHDF